MAKFKTPLRRRLLNNFNRQRNRLKKSGATLEDLDQVFGIKTYEKFSKLSTDELVKLDKKLKTYGSKSVESGRVMSERFLRNKKAMEDITGLSSRLPKNFKSQVNSMAFSFKDTKEIKRYYLDRQYLAKRNYVEQVRRYGERVSKRLERMSLKNFNKMIDISGGLASFDRVFITSPKNLPDSLLESEYDELNEEVMNTIKDVDRFSRLINRMT